MSETTVIHVRDMQPGDVYIGRRNSRRRLKESIWANDLVIDKDHPRELVITHYEQVIRDVMLLEPEFWNIETLRGKRLACWCHPKPCHGDVLVKILSEREPTR